MNELTKLIIVSGFVGVLSITGCGKDSAPKDSSAHADHNHAGEDDNHDHDHADTYKDDDGHAPTRPLGSVVIAGTTLEVSAGGQINPGAELNVNIKHIDGPIPAEIRLWIGNPAGDGAMRSKTEHSGGNYHAHAEMPAVINDDTALWIEIETTSGERVSSSVPLI